MGIKFNHNMFSVNLNNTYFEMMKEKRANPDVRFHVETNTSNEDVEVNVIEKDEVVRSFILKEGRKHYKKQREELSNEKYKA